MNAMHALVSYVHSSCFLYQGRFYFTHPNTYLDNNPIITQLSFIHVWLDTHTNISDTIKINFYHSLNEPSIMHIYDELQHKSDYYEHLIDILSTIERSMFDARDCDETSLYI